MGGKVMDCQDERAIVSGLEFTRVALPPSEVRRVLLDEQAITIPLVSHKAIQDKSKADSLLKAIVCLQAMWFCLQFIIRLAQQLSVSLLELNTFAHAICALLIYAFWWHKPLDIDHPTLFRVPLQEQQSIAYARTMHNCTNVDFYRFKQRNMNGTQWVTVWLPCSILLESRSDPSGEPGPLLLDELKDKISLRLDSIDITRLAIPVKEFPQENPRFPKLGGRTFSNLRLDYVSYEPPVFLLKGLDKIPCTTRIVINSLVDSVEVDQGLLEKFCNLDKQWHPISWPRPWRVDNGTSIKGLFGFLGGAQWHQWTEACALALCGLFYMFSEPGICLIRPDGTLYMAQQQSAPFARPDFGALLEGIDYVLDKDYPPRGDLT